VGHHALQVLFPIRVGLRTGGDSTAAAQRGGIQDLIERTNVLEIVGNRLLAAAARVDDAGERRSMSIVSLYKATLAGHLDDKEDVLTGLQELGCLHLIPLTPEGEPAADTGPSKEAREALRFLASTPQRRRQVTDARRFDADAVERQALDLQRRLYELRNERDFLSTRIQNLEPWGDFAFPGIDHGGDS
jgi:hypothetical protein